MVDYFRLEANGKIHVMNWPVWQIAAETGIVGSLWNGMISFIQCLRTLRIIKGSVHMYHGKSTIAIPPGETIREMLEDRNMTQAEFAVRMGLSEKYTGRLLNGHVVL